MFDLFLNVSKKKTKKKESISNYYFAILQEIRNNSVKQEIMNLRSIMNEEKNSNEKNDFELEEEEAKINHLLAQKKKYVKCLRKLRIQCRKMIYKIFAQTRYKVFFKPLVIILFFYHSDLCL